jgi:hypothetical protein
VKTMNPRDIINMVTAIATAAAVVMALFIAIFQDWLRSLCVRPKLSIDFRFAPPDCMKTQWQFRPDQPVLSVTTGPYYGDSGIPRSTADVYYFRIRVTNSGRRKAEMVEVFATELRKQQADGETFERVEAFVPMNLVWSYDRSVFWDIISPGVSKHCDLAHINDPGAQEWLTDQQRKFLGISPQATSPKLILDTYARADAFSHELETGKYQIDIEVTASNAKSTRETVEIAISLTLSDNDQ